MSFTRGDDAAGGGGTVSYGEIYYSADSASLSAQVTYKTASFTTAGTFSGVTLDAVASNIAVDQTGDWLVMARVNVETQPNITSDSSQAMTFKIYVDGAAHARDTFALNRMGDDTSEAHACTFVVQGTLPLTAGEKVSLVYREEVAETSMQFVIKKSSRLAVLFLNT